MPLLELPSHVLALILGQLPIQDLLSYGGTCQQAIAHARSDEYCWRPLCRRYTRTLPAEWGCSSYRDLYATFLHKYGRILGCWRGRTQPTGSVLLVQLNPPVIHASTVVVRSLNGPVMLRRLFVIRRAPNGPSPHATEIHCVRACGEPNLQGVGMMAGGAGAWHAHSSVVDLQSPHTAHVSFPEQAGDCFEISCQALCLQDVSEILLRKLPVQLLALEQQEAGEDETDAGSDTLHLPGPAPDTHPRLYPDVLQGLPDGGMLTTTLDLEFLSAWRRRRSDNDDLHVATYERLKVPAPVHWLEGIWRGTYGGHGIELLQIEHYGSDSTGNLGARKLTGDVNVPVAAFSFYLLMHTHEVLHKEQEFQLPPGYAARVDLETGAPLMIKERMKGYGHVAQIGYSEPTWVEAELLVFSRSCFGMVWPTIATFSLFTRVQLPGCARAAPRSSNGPFLTAQDSA